MSAVKPQLSKDQVAVSVARKLKPTSSKPREGSSQVPILVRDWVNVRPPSDNAACQIKLMTWNMLAQSLVRALYYFVPVGQTEEFIHVPQGRELFPTSDCLKASQREGMLVGEILKYNPDIVCLQEVDRLEKLLPPLKRAAYAELYAAGQGKRHGCMIVYRDAMFEKTEHIVIDYDELDVRQAGDERKRKGSSRRTKNIGLIAGLRRRDQPNNGYIVATTHLFWHPSFTYERLRQAALLLREVAAFRETHALPNWPCIIAGDFNFAPSDPAYSLLVGDSLIPQQSRDIEISRVVHVSIDSSVVQAPAAPKDDDEGDTAQADPDRVITNSRPAKPDDGLLSDEELDALFKMHGSLRSVYDEGQRSTKSEHDNVIGTRLNTLTPRRKGYFEPMWTSYTHYWKTTLDYIFLLERSGPRSNVLGFLKTHRTSDLGKGLPLKGVCGSDHISLVGAIETATSVIDTT